MGQGGSRLLRAGKLTTGTSITCFVLAIIEYFTGWISFIAPTEVHLFAWLAIIAVVAIVVVNVRREPNAPRLPDVGQAIKRLLFPAPPVAKRTYAQRQRRIINE